MLELLEVVCFDDRDIVKKFYDIRRIAFYQISFKRRKYINIDDFSAMLSTFDAHIFM